MKILFCAPLLVSFALVDFASPPPGRSVAATEYKVDPVHSSVIFRIKHVEASYFWGAFGHVEGEMTLDADAVERSSVKIRVKAESVDTRAEGRDRHVRGPDFLDAKQFPWISFESEKVRGIDAKTFEVAGKLAIHGVTKPVSMRVSYTGTGEFRGTERNGYETTFTIKRSDFGVSYGLDSKVLGDEIRLTFALEMAKQ